MKIQRLLPQICSLTLTALASTASAQTFWDGNGTGGTKNWSDGVNWDTDTVPTSGSNVEFYTGNLGNTNVNVGNQTSGNVTFSGNQTAQFNFQAGNWTITSGIDRTISNVNANYQLLANLTVTVDADGIYLNNRGLGQLRFDNRFVGATTANISINQFSGGSGGGTVRLAGNNTNFLGNYIIHRGTLSIDANPTLALGGTTPTSKVIFNNSNTFNSTSSLSLNTGTGNIIWYNDIINNNESTSGSANTATISFTGGTGSNASLTLAGNFSTGPSVHSSSRLTFAATTSGGNNQSEGRIFLTGDWSGYNGTVDGVFVSGAGAVFVQNSSALAASNVNYGINYIGTATVGTSVPGSGLAMSAKLILGGNFTMNNNLTFSGAGGPVNSFGAMNGGGTTTMSGNVSVVDPQGANLFSANSTGTMKFTNNISSNSTHPLLINGNFTYNPGTGAQNFQPTGIVEFARPTGITYNGSVTVVGGTLLVNNTSGNGTGTGALTVLSGATLGGSGIIGGATTINGTLSPGNSPGLLTFNSTLTLNTGSTTLMEVGATTTRGGTFDAVDVTGALTYGGNLTLNITQTFGVGTYSWDLFNFGSQSGNFANVLLTGSYSGSLTNSGGTWSLTSGSEAWTFTQSDGVLALTVIPEPATWALLVASLTAMIIFRRRRRVC